MTATTKFTIRLLVLLWLSLLTIAGFAQSIELDPSKCAAELSKKDHSALEYFRRLDSTLQNTDSTLSDQFINQLEYKGDPRNYFFDAQFKSLKARTLFYKNVSGKQFQSWVGNDRKLVQQQITDLFVSAMNTAYTSEDDYLVTHVGIFYAITAIRFDNYWRQIHKWNLHIEIDARK